MTRIRIPPTLRAEVGGAREVEASGATLRDVLDDLVARHPALEGRLFENGDVASFVNVYVNDDDIRYLDREATALKSGDVISIVPSVAGGAPVTEAAATPELSNAEIERYSRHLILPEVGIDGQRRLKAGRVLCVGAGGLGSPAALYLAAAGVGPARHELQVIDDTQTQPLRGSRRFVAAFDFGL